MIVVLSSLKCYEGRGVEKRESSSLKIALSLSRADPHTLTYSPALHKRP